MHVAFTSLAIVAGVALAAPLALGVLPRIRLPAVVLEIVPGIVVGPAVLGWAHVDAPLEVMSLLGLAFLLLLARLEVEFDMLRGRLLRTTSLGFVVSFAVALAAGVLLDAVDISGAPLLIAIMLSATSLGVVVPVLKGQRRSVAAALLQATSLGFFVVAGQIGMDLDLISKATGAALVAAGLLSVLLFPLGALTLLRYETSPSRSASQAA